MYDGDYVWNGDTDCCINCGYAVFVCDYERGSVCCDNCGCCRDDVLAVVDCTHKDSQRQIGGSARKESYAYGARYEDVASERVFLSSRRKNSPPYKRETYWSERISQWQLKEPDIEDSHWRVIVAKWEEWTGIWWSPDDCGPLPQFPAARWRRGIDGSMRCNLVLTKEMCRQLLWAIDDDIRGRFDGKPIFVKKYLVSVASLHFCCFFGIAHFDKRSFDGECHGTIKWYTFGRAPTHGSVQVALVAHAVGANRFPTQVVHVDAARVPAQVAGFIVFIDRVMTGLQQHNGWVPHAIVVTVLAARLLRVEEGASRSLRVGLNERHLAAAVGER